MDINKNISLRDSFKKLKLNDFVYPAVIMTFLCVTLILFFFTTQFISKNINKIFATEDSGASEALNINEYNLIAKKLNLATTTASGAPTATLSAGATMAPTISPDKRALTISIKNSTAAKGVATTLAKILETAGYTKATTTNEKKLYATTTVFIKESKVSFAPGLLEIIKKTYPAAIATTTPETTSSDATIIIGTH